MSGWRASGAPRLPRPSPPREPRAAKAARRRDARHRGVRPRGSRPGSSGTYTPRSGTGAVLQPRCLRGTEPLRATSGSLSAHYQKRLILEHAARMSPRLHVAKNTLELGWEVDGEIAKVAKADVPELACGFVGEPDPGGFYSKGNRVEKNTAASGAAPMADSKGRIG